MAINNFKKLEQEHIEKYSPDNNIQKRINKTLSIYQFIGGMADLFFTKFIGAAIGKSSEVKTERKRKYPNNQD